VLLLNIANVNN